MDLLQVLESKYIENISFKELKSILTFNNGILYKEPQSIMLKNGTIIKCVGKYYKPTDGEALPPKGKTIQTCMKVQKNLFKSFDAPVSFDCAKCHLKCLDLQKEGRIERY